MRWERLRRHQSDLVATSWSVTTKKSHQNHTDQAPQTGVMHCSMLMSSSVRILPQALYIYLLPGAFYAHKCREFFVIAKVRRRCPNVVSHTMVTANVFIYQQPLPGTRLKLLGQVPLVLTIYSLALGYIPVLYKHLHRESYLFEGDVWHVRRISNGSWSPSMGMDEAKWETWTFCESKYWRMKV